MATPNIFSNKTGQIALTLLDENFEYIDTQLDNVSSILSTDQIKIGTNAGETNQGDEAIAIGLNAARLNQSYNGISIGWGAGQENQIQGGIAIGTDAGRYDQGNNAIALGSGAGNAYQAQRSISIGSFAGASNQSSESIAIGYNAGEFDQDTQSVALGPLAAFSNQGGYSVAIGTSAADTNQGNNCIAIGQAAGSQNQGDYAIAIGMNAGASSQHVNSIVLNASGSILNSPAASSFTVKPIAELSQTASNILQYNPNTGEINYTPASIAVQVVHNVYTGKTTYSVPTAGETGTYIAALDTTITPTRSINKIRVEFNMSFEVHHDTVLRLFRVINGVTSEVVRNGDGNYWSGFAYPGYDADNSSTPQTNHYTYIDSPNTTSAITYRLMIQSGGVGATTFYLNRPISSAGAANYENAISQCILTEIPQ